MYQFSLEPLLRHRKFVEESIQKDLALMEREFNQELKILEELNDKQVQLSHELKTRKTSNMHPKEFCMYQTYTFRLSKEVEVQQKKVRDIEEQVNMVRMELLSAVKDRKTIEKLKEKKKKDYMQKISKKEQMLINEAAVIRFNRNGQ